VEREAGSGRRAREMRKYRRNELLILFLILAVLAGFFLILYLGKLHKVWDPEENAPVESTADAEKERLENEHINELIAAAERIAAGYDFDGAVTFLKSDPLYSKKLVLLEKAEEILKRKDDMKAWADVKNITHLTFRPLIADTSQAFTSLNAAKYNKENITVEEFKAILNELYSRGYVLVSLHDIAYSKAYTNSLKGIVETTAEGDTADVNITLTESETVAEEPTEETTESEAESEAEVMDESDDESDESDDESEEETSKTTAVPTTADPKKLKAGRIMLPEGKTPIVISVENICPLPAMQTEGFAKKLILGKEGEVLCELSDGRTGRFDLVTVLEEFIDEHPDFSYRGARAVLGISGENGIFGYRTASIYEDEEGYNSEIESARLIADTLKKLGYEFGMNGYHYSNMGNMSLEEIMVECQAWNDEVASIIGTTDIIVFPNGSDIGDWRYYSGERYDYLKDNGYVYFLNMNSSERAWNQILNYYMRQGRRLVTGLSLYKDLSAGGFSDVFDAAKVYDNSHLPM